jgi:hypothetical protein
LKKDYAKVKLFLCLIIIALCHENTWEKGDVVIPFWTSALIEVSGQLHTPAALPPGKEYPVPIR